MRHPLRLVGLCFVGMIAARGALAQTPPTPPPLRLVVSSGLQGDVARLACVAPGERTAGFNALARSLNHPTGDDVLRLDAGDLFGASAIAHLATHDHLPALVDAVLASGLRALAIGHRDLAGTRADVIARARALATPGSCPTCAGSRRGACARCSATLAATPLGKNSATPS